MGEDVMEQEFMKLSNAELADAISITYERIRKTGTGCGSYQPLVAHLKALLAEQLKRAT
jgi:hypothetical protein